LHIHALCSRNAEVMALISPARLDRALDRGLDRGLDKGLERGLDRGVDKDSDRGFDRALTSPARVVTNGRTWTICGR